VSQPSDPTRRGLLGFAAGIVAGALTREARADAPPAEPAVVVPPDATKVLGSGTTANAARSPFVTLEARPTGVVTGTSHAPIQGFSGTIFPTDAQFQRHHGGIAQIDPAAWKLLVHGLVDRPLVFTLDELKRFPSVTRAHFLECSGNGRKAYREPKPEMTPQDVDGQLSSQEWTGVPLSRVLAEAGVQASAKWILAEGGDAAVLARSLPLEKALDDCLLVWAANGEPLRPAHGFPVRLLAPGFEANTNIKWLRRIELLAEPSMTKDETAKYTDPLPGDRARMFSFGMDAKSIITSPSHPMTLTEGFWPVTGLAWSGRGRIDRVEVSTDAGATWAQAELQGANTPRSMVRFVFPWRWSGEPAVLMSRAVDETGYVQPSLAAYREARGIGTDYHFNAIRAWRVDADGKVWFDTEIR
jgi:sulfane dehydrogenase subunit SoxC